MNHNRFSSFIYLLRFIWENLKILINPKKLTSIWNMRLHSSWPLARQYLDFCHSQSALIDHLKSRPNHSTFYSSLILGRSFAPGTLGAEYQQFFAKYRVGPDFYPDLIEIRDEIDFLNSHVICIHDLWHIALGFSPHILGEIKISAFSVAQFRSPMHASFVLLALLSGVLNRSEYLPQIMDAICEGWQKGLQYKNLMWIEWENWLDLPLGELQAFIQTRQ